MSIKYLISSVFVALAIGCTVMQPDEPQLVQKEITITAYRADEEQPEAKTQRDESDGSVWWTPGDAISLFYGSGTAGGNRFVSTATQPSKVTNFTGTIGVITGGADVSVEDTYFWGLYPYNETASCDGSSVTTTLPSEQVATPSTFANNLFPSLGRSQGLSMGFYNICGGVRFTVTKEGLKKVTLRALGGESLTGRARIGFENGVPKVLEITDGSDEITLTAPDGEYLEVGKYYYFITFPQPLSQGIELKFETFTEEGTFERQTSSLTIKRSIFGTLNNVDQNVVYAQKTGNIPVEDPNFKAYLVENFDTNGDGEISYEEARLITTIDTRTTGIASIRGIEFMENLTHLNVGNDWGVITTHNSVDTFFYSYSEPRGLLQSIDVSNNKMLEELDCFYNQLSNLDISGNTALTHLDCDANSISALDVSNNTALTVLWCDDNSLTSINVSKNSALTVLGCGLNSITSLDVSNNTALTELVCSANPLSSLDVSNNTALTRLDCSHNSLTSLDISNNPALTRLNCNQNQLTTLDVSSNTALTRLDCPGNSLASLDVSNNTALTYLNCCFNSLSSLDVSNNTALTVLWCHYNTITSLEVLNNAALTELWCQNNSLASLDVSKNTALTRLRCSANNLTTLNVSKNTALIDLWCAPMESLLTLSVAQGQEIPYVTINRSDEHIPAGTEIVVIPSGGGGEGTGNENW